MKKHIPHVIIIIAILGIIFLSFRACSLYDRNSILKGQYDTLKKIAATDHAALTNEIGQLTNDNILKDKEIAQLRESIIIINTALAGKDQDLDAMRKSWAKLSVECQAALQALDAKWEEKALLYEDAIRAEQDTTKLWIGKYNNAVKIGDGWKRDYENEHTLRLLGERRIGKLENSLRWSRFWKTGATALAVVAGGYVGYTLIKGK
jgi:hypothetical protein